MGVNCNLLLPIVEILLYWRDKNNLNHRELKNLFSYEPPMPGAGTHEAFKIAGMGARAAGRRWLLSLVGEGLTPSRAWGSRIQIFSMSVLCALLGAGGD